MKTSWNAFKSDERSQEELWMMTQMARHPKLRRIRIKMMIEGLTLVGFLCTYYNLFDGQSKPLWANALLIVATIAFVANDLMSLYVLLNPIRNLQLMLSLKSFHVTLRRIHLSSIITSLAFACSLLLFFTSNLVFTLPKYALLFGITASLLGFTIWSNRIWLVRIKQIAETTSLFASLRS